MKLQVGDKSQCEHLVPDVGGYRFFKCKKPAKYYLNTLWRNIKNIKINER
jgi:hypothetical protein